MGVPPNSGYLETIHSFLKHFGLCGGQSNKGINLYWYKPLISGSSIGRITIKRTPWRTAIMIMGNGIFITESTIKNWLKYWRFSWDEKLYKITVVSHP